MLPLCSALENVSLRIVASLGQVSARLKLIVSISFFYFYITVDSYYIAFQDSIKDIC